MSLPAEEILEMSEPGRLFRSPHWSFLLLLPVLAFAATLAAFAQRSPSGEVTRRLTLSPCHLEGFREEVRCGTLRVPENRATRTGRTIDLKVAVIPALRPESAPDPLFVFAGG
ncbi:MAG TPA: hypothetical protein VJ885_06745, partial [Thermoanaerobaculia bacterium]|nr:hypothetical protein [Thermoanaerobaculia bacterium]